MSWRYLQKPQLSMARMYEILRKPVITEKATMASEANQVTFMVASDANKAEVRASVEGLFKVKVLGINTINTKGKQKRFRGRLGVRNATRKAIVTLAEGDSIDLGATL